MRPWMLWLVVLGLMAALPPWACRGELGRQVVLGMPLWAAGSLGMAVVFAAVTVWGITRGWDRLSGGDGDGDGDGGGEGDGR